MPLHFFWNFSSWESLVSRPHSISRADRTLLKNIGFQKFRSFFPREKPAKTFLPFHFSRNFAFKKVRLYKIWQFVFLYFDPSLFESTLNTFLFLAVLKMKQTYAKIYWMSTGLLWGERQIYTKIYIECPLVCYEEKKLNTAIHKNVIICNFILQFTFFESTHYTICL